MASFLVECLAHGCDGQARDVEVPDDQIAQLGDIVDEGDRTEALLSLIFAYGQNENQPVPGTPSVSAGDVVRLNGMKDRWLCVSFGWTKLSLSDYWAYQALPREDRLLARFRFQQEGSMV